MTETKSRSRAKCRIADALSKHLDKSISPDAVNVFPAVGYWTHKHQDCQRWTGHVEADGGLLCSIGSWGLTLSVIGAGGRFQLLDHREESDTSYSDFSFERPEQPHD